MDIFKKEPVIKNNVIPPQKEVPKTPSPETPKDESLFHGMSQISRYEIDKALRKDPKGRAEIKKEFKIGGELQVNAKVDELEKHIPDRFGGTISKSEAQSAMKDPYWNATKDDKNKYLSSKELEKKKKEGAFLKKKFGIK